MLHQQSKSSLQPTLDKKAFVDALRGYIKHCKLVSANSYSDYYRSLAKAKAWDAVGTFNQTLLRFTEVNLTQLKYFTRINADALREILPHPENTSYKNQLEKITQLIDYAKQ